MTSQHFNNYFLYYPIGLIIDRFPGTGKRKNLEIIIRSRDPTGENTFPDTVRHIFIIRIAVNRHPICRIGDIGKTGIAASDEIAIG